MKDETLDLLDDILSHWHHWCKTDKLVPKPGVSAMFRQARSPRHWQNSSDLADESVSHDRMEAVDFNVWEMTDPYRAAIQIIARNAYTGRSVWISPRLPSDKQDRIEVCAKARFILMQRLVSAGIL